jgi:DNA processing protein
MPAPVTLTRLDPRYPSRLAASELAPPAISWSGGSLEAARTVAIVGSRHATPEAVAFASELAAALVGASIVVVSGGAEGIDAAAHKSALCSGGRTWAVAGTGPDHCYPAAHADLFDAIARGPGAMLWPFDSGSRGKFLARNGVLVALADAVVVVQAGLVSGALNAASWAQKLGKALWVVPAAPWMTDFSGSLRLLEQGARPVSSIDALLGSLGLNLRQAPERATCPSTDSGAGDNMRALSPSESEVLTVMSNAPLHLDAIITRAGQPAQVAAAALLTLALENVVVEGPPGFFRRRDASRR